MKSDMRLVPTENKSMEAQLEGNKDNRNTTWLGVS
jgi:hypothetical protein